MTDDEVKVLIENLKVSKLEERDQQEVAGYFTTLDIISESFTDIDITEGNIKNLHKSLLNFSTKDEWHKGNYKQHTNRVEATHADGLKHTIFKTTEPGFATEDAMEKLVKWYRSDTQTHPLIRSAIFVYDFLSIHPFQDGNGRVSRLLATLLLLKHGYSWIQYISFEHEIENRKSEYYRELMQCQSKRPGEDVTSWVIFFLDCLKNIQDLLIKKLDAQARADHMSQREKMVYAFIGNHPGSKSGEIAERLNIPLPTTKRILADMVANKYLRRQGVGAGTNYSIENKVSIKKDLVFRLTNAERKKEFLVKYSSSFIEIKKIILTPLFEWIRSDEWVARLSMQQLYLKIDCTSNKGGRKVQQSYLLSSYNHPNLHSPVFTLSHPINLPVGLWEDLWSGAPNSNDYPINIMIELMGSATVFDFEILVVYDEG